MTARLSSTEALLAMVAAETCDERLAAFEALMVTGPAMLRPIDLDRVAPVVGDGGAGAQLLGGSLVGEHATRHVSVALRVGRVMRRHDAAPDPFAPDAPDAWAGVPRW